MGGQPVPGSSLTMITASPEDSRIDEFEFGGEWWETEIAQEFKSRLWEPKRDLFLFLSGETAVAGARMGFWNRRHPSRNSEFDKARYFLVLSLGVNVEFQSERDPVDPSRTYASVILDEVERRARERVDCVGISLHVREANARARHVYEKRGFQYDGDVFEEDGRPTLEMRKWF